MLLFSFLQLLVFVLKEIFWLLFWLIMLLFFLQSVVFSFLVSLVMLLFFSFLRPKVLSVGHLILWKLFSFLVVLRVDLPLFGTVQT